MKHIFALVSFVLFVFYGGIAHADSKVVVSIKPLHSLVAAVMGETGTPILLVRGAQSPHGYQLKPSQITQLQKADIVFYIGPVLETFLARPLATLSANVKTFAMINAPGVTVMPPRAGGSWEFDADAAPAKGSPQDPHIWLNVQNAKAMVKEITKNLSATYPANARIYIKNAATIIKKLDALNATLKKKLEQERSKPYIVFHDAFHYFEKSYGL